MKLRDYNSLDHLEGTMFEFGRYRLVYDPPIDSVDAEVKMTISAEASLPQMLDFFATFLRASGYIFEGELEIAEKTETGRSDYPDTSAQTKPWATCDR